MVAFDNSLSPATSATTRYYGACPERSRRNAYGTVTIWDDTLTNTRSASSFGNPYTFTGRRLDALDNGSLNLMYYRARAYDPQTGRFMQRDPFAYIDSMNQYNYVTCEPIKHFDPFGLRRGGGNGGKTCGNIQRLANLIENLPEGSPARIDNLHKLYHLFAIFGGKAGYPTAAKMMDYWLSGGTEDQPITKKLILSDPDGKAVYDYSIDWHKQAVTCEDSGTTGPVARNVNPHVGDLQYTTGTFNLNSSGEFHIDKKCECDERKLEIKFWMRDPYGWINSGGKVVHICGAEIPDSWAQELSDARGLSVFDVVAEWTDKFGCVPCK